MRHWKRNRWLFNNQMLLGIIVILADTESVVLPFRRMKIANDLFSELPNNKDNKK